MRLWLKVKDKTNKNNNQSKLRLECYHVCESGEFLILVNWQFHPERHCYQHFLFHLIFTFRLDQLDPKKHVCRTKTLRTFKKTRDEMRRKERVVEMGRNMKQRIGTWFYSNFWRVKKNFVIVYKFLLF